MDNLEFYYVLGWLVTIFNCLIVALIGKLLIARIATANMKLGRSDRVAKAFNNVESDFSPTQTCLGLTDVDGNLGIAIDEDRKKVCFIIHGESEPALKFYSYRDILHCELLEDQFSITRTSRSSQLANAFLGGVLFGGPGALIGSLTSASHSSDGGVKEIAMHVIVNDTESPLKVVRFLLAYHGEYFPRNGEIYKKNFSLAQHWYALLKVLIERAEKEASLVEDPPPSLVDSSTAELVTLSGLLDNGLITREEFELQKTKIIYPAPK